MPPFSECWGTFESARCVGRGDYNRTQTKQVARGMGVEYVLSVCARVWFGCGRESCFFSLRVPSPFSRMLGDILIWIIGHNRHSHESHEHAQTNAQEFYKRAPSVVTGVAPLHTTHMNCYSPHDYHRKREAHTLMKR